MAKPFPRPDMTVTPTGKLLTEAIIAALLKKHAALVQATKKAA